MTEHDAEDLEDEVRSSRHKSLTGNLEFNFKNDIQENKRQHNIQREATQNIFPTTMIL